MLLRFYRSRCKTSGFDLAQKKWTDLQQQNKTCLKGDRTSNFGELELGDRTQIQASMFVSQLSGQLSANG
jgi:hypothetical protein